MILRRSLFAQYPETLHFTEVTAKYLKTDIHHLCLVNGSSEESLYYPSLHFERRKDCRRCAFLFHVPGLCGNVAEFCSCPLYRGPGNAVSHILEHLTAETELLILPKPE